MKFIYKGEVIATDEESGGSPASSTPSGIIVIWSGSSDNLPEGWALCDGEKGTPDLRDRFVLGAGKTHSVGDAGGSEEVTLTVEQMPEHRHTVGGFNTGTSGKTAYMGSNGIGTGITVYSNYAGSSQPHPNMPPYYALCYIMKL